MASSIPSSISPRQVLFGVLALFWAMVSPAQEDRPGDDAEVVAPPLEADHFDALTQNSPFLRTIAPNKSMIFTGIAEIDGETWVTLIDTETREKKMISGKGNEEGWRLLGLDGEERGVKAMRARIEVARGEVITLLYGEPPQVKNPKAQVQRKTVALNAENLREARDSARNYTKGFSSDGFAAEPPPEVAAKLKQISVSDRERINREMIQLRVNGMGSEARKKIYVDKVNKASAGKR